MIIMYQGKTLPLPGATPAGLAALVLTMQHAVRKWNADGKPNSGDPK